MSAWHHTNLHDKARVSNIIVVSAVGVHQYYIEWELCQGDVGINIGVRLVQPLHLNLVGRTVTSRKTTTQYYLLAGEPKRFKLDLTVLLIYWEPVEVHVTGHVIVDPGGVSDGAVIVHPQGGWLGVVGWDSQGFGLVNKHIWHPELLCLAWVQGYVLSNWIFTVQSVCCWFYSLILVKISSIKKPTIWNHPWQLSNTITNAILITILKFLWPT